jgi:hypothetical protein
MNNLGVCATFAACALFAACEHGGPAPRELPPLPSTMELSPTGTAHPGLSAIAETERKLHSDDDLHLLPPAQRMPITDVPAQPMPAGPDVEPVPSSVKPDAGGTIQWDAGAPLPPIPDGGPLPQTRDASVPL